MATRTTIRAQKGWAAVMLVVWVLLALISLALLLFSITDVWMREQATAVILCITGGFLLAVAADLTMNFVRVLRLDEPLLEFSHDGFVDRRLMSKVVPWSAIEWLVFRAKGGAILIDVAAPYDQAMYSGIWSSFASGFAKLFGFPRYTVSPHATGLSVVQLETLFAQFKSQNMAISSAASKPSV